MKAGLTLLTISTLSLLLGTPPVLALNPSLDIGQYGHTAWTARDGFSAGTIFAIAQTPDGYLWLGSEFGLFRFDGVQQCPMATACWSAAPGRALQFARRARRHSMDRHVCRPRELEWRQTDAVPGNW